MAIQRRFLVRVESFNGQLRGLREKIECNYIENCMECSSILHLNKEEQKNIQWQRKNKDASFGPDKGSDQDSID